MEIFCPLHYSRRYTYKIGYTPYIVADIVLVLQATPFRAVLSSASAYPATLIPTSRAAAYD